MPRENEGRDPRWGIRKLPLNHQKHGRGVEQIFPHCPEVLNLPIPLSQTSSLLSVRQYISIVYFIPFLVLCYGSLKKQMQLSIHIWPSSWLKHRWNPEEGQEINQVATKDVLGRPKHNYSVTSRLHSELVHSFLTISSTKTVFLLFKVMAATDGAKGREDCPHRQWQWRTAIYTDEISRRTYEGKV